MALRSTVNSSAAQRAARPSRSAVVVRASAESRRAVLSGFAAGAAALLTAGAASANQAVDLFDDRAAKQRGYDLIYEARDLDLPQNVRDGFTQARTNLDATKARVKESEKRLDADVYPSVNKAYWTEAREQLRRQVGTLRFDLNTLASAQVGKEEKKAALALRKEFLQAVEDLDLALRKKDKDLALAKLQAAQLKLDSVLAKVL